MPAGKLVRIVPKRKQKKTRVATVALVKKLIDNNTEDKTITGVLSSSFGSISSSWSELNPLSGCTQGVTGITHIGRKLRLKSIEIKGVLVQGSSENLADDAYNVVRMVIALWTGTSDTPCGTGGQGISNMLRKYSQSAADNMKTKLYDKYHFLNVTSTEKGGGDGYTPNGKVLHYYKRFKKPVLIEYGNDSNNYPTQRLIIGCISDSAAVSNPGFTHGWWAVTYEDA